MNDEQSKRDPSRHYIVVVGASAGGLQAISQLVSRLPRELPAATHHGRSNEDVGAVATRA
ncbi:chemotaxis protein CheB [Allorhodopirellula solitaria]|uniref:chemotaxis protein CheB n=1 Tax=Allorhodopirellula solitaria TaxID=2527987 RepID=UPI0011B56E50